MRIETERERSFAAPRDRLWPLATAIHRYLDTIPEILTYQVDPAGRTATFDGRLKVGPVVWNVSGDGSVEPAGDEVVVRLDIPKLALRYAGRLALADAGSGTTRVIYRGGIDCEHRLAGRLHFLLRKILVDHFALFLDDVLAQAELSWGAQQAMDGRARRAADPS